jgi:acetyltransferase-like isoleucine patch superfamily enzyme
MNRQMAANDAQSIATRFIRTNGLYLFVQELGRRSAVVFRRWMLAGRLGCTDVVLGPRCYLRGLAHMTIGKSFRVAEGLWMEAITSYAGHTYSPSIVIGDHVTISRGCHIAATHRIEIGDGTLIGSNVLITDHHHGQYRDSGSDIQIRPSLRPLDQDRTVLIGKNVWLGDGVVVMPDTTIGEGCVIGANSVVTGDVRPYTIAAGAPAVALKTFDFEIQKWRRL